MQSEVFVLGAGGLLFAYVLLRFATTIMHAGKKRRHLAQNGLILLVAAPILLFVPSPIDIPNADLRTLLFGSALWVTLAMAFAAFALSRAKNGDEAVA
jgi:hypothetical protein